MDSSGESVAGRRRARARLAKQRAIADVAVRLALERGLDAATVDAISEAADISRRTFFNYFAAKEDALAMAPAVPADDVVEFIVNRPADERPARVMRELAKQIAEAFVPSREQIALWRQHPHLMARVQAGGEDHLFLAVMTAVAEKWNYDLAADAYPAVLVTTTFSVVQYTVRASWIPEIGKSVDELIDAAFDVLESGL